MIRAIRLYREYRRQGLRRAWRLSGLSRLAWSALKYAAACALAIGIAVAMSRHADALGEAAENRVAARLSNQAAEINELRHIVAKCLGNQEGALFIGGELYLCQAVPTGIRL